VPLAEQPGREFVVAMIGKFSSPRELEFRRFEPAEFACFAEAGFGKVAASFLVLPYGDSRALLCTETRTATTDPDTARRSQSYWTVIRPFADYILWHWLALAKQHAEQPASWARLDPARSGAEVAAAEGEHGHRHQDQRGQQEGGQVAGVQLTA
jgi:hypothetical protein